MPELQAIEAIASAQIDEPESGGATTRRVCPCGCGRPVNPGRTYAARGCTARSPETRAKMSAAAKRRSKRVKDPSGGYRLEGGPFIGDQPVPAESNHDNANYWSQQIRAYQLDVSAVELDPQEQAASRAVHWLRRLPTNTAREAAYRLACELGEVACG